MKYLHPITKKEAIQGEGINSNMYYVEGFPAFTLGELDAYGFVPVEEKKTPQWFYNFIKTTPDYEIGGDETLDEFIERIYPMYLNHMPKQELYTQPVNVVTGWQYEGYKPQSYTITTNNTEGQGTIATDIDTIKKTNQIHDKQELDTITRFEVIDDHGRVYVYKGVSIRQSIQDEGRTLKVFVEGVGVNMQEELIQLDVEKCFNEINHKLLGTGLKLDNTRQELIKQILSKYSTTPKKKFTRLEIENVVGNMKKNLGMNIRQVNYNELRKY